MVRVRTSKEAIELHQELEVDIVALGSLPMGVSDVMAIKIDTCMTVSLAILLFGEGSLL